MSTTDVVMPQMGESIAEGTIVRWIKKVGEPVERDEPLFEISTDKVDAEVPSPAGGVLAEIRAHEGETVPVNSVVAVIGAAGSVGTTPPASAPAAAASRSPARPQAASPASSPPEPAQETQSAQRAPSSAAPGDGVKQRSSPVVRRIAKEHEVDISQIAGSGIGGRVTKDDILAFVSGEAGPSQSAAGRSAAPGAAAPRQETRHVPPPSAKGGPTPGTTVPMSVMRKKIAEHMIVSKRTSAHVHSVFEVNFHRVARLRESKKSEYERAGVKLTYLSFILKAVADALRVVPIVNSSVDGDSIVYHEDVNLGVAVALDWGLIVPVIKRADEKNVLGLSRSLADLAARARAKQLKPDEVSGGTFTITNPGSLGSLVGMPIINQPQVAILGVGAIEKRVVAVDDAIGIRPMGYLSLGYDHRIIDGAVADEFMSHLKKTLETWDEEI